MGFAQEDGEPVVWTATLNRVSESLVEIQFDAVIKDKWHLYTLKEFKDGPLPTEFVFFKDSLAFSIENSMTTSEPSVEYDQIFEID
jgi:thiol:disulfide interchange protein DsbD